VLNQFLKKADISFQPLTTRFKLNTHFPSFYPLTKQLPHPPPLPTYQDSPDVIKKDSQTLKTGIEHFEKKIGNLKADISELEQLNQVNNPFFF
jgi:hypothetical protein